MSKPRQPAPETVRNTVRDGLGIASDTLPAAAPNRIGRLTLRLRRGAGPEDVAAAFGKALRARMVAGEQRKEETT